MYKQEIYTPISEKARLHPIYAGLAVFIGVILLVFGQAVPAIPAYFLGIIGPEAKYSEQVGMLFSLFVITGFSAAVIFLWVRYLENRSLASMGWRLRGSLPAYVRGFLIGLVMNCIAVLCIGLLGGYTMGDWLPALHHVSALGIIGLFLLGFMVQGASEEILTRGWLNSTIAARFGFPVAVVLTSVLFSSMHLANPDMNVISFVNIVLVAIFFSIYAFRERSIMGACAIHSAWNWIMSVGFGLNVSGIRLDVEPLLVNLTQRTEPAAWITGGGFGPEASAITSGVLVVAIILAWFMKQQPLPDAA